MNEHLPVVYKLFVCGLAFVVLWMQPAVLLADEGLVEILSIRKNAQRLISGECRATGQYTLQIDSETKSERLKPSDFKRRLEERENSVHSPSRSSIPKSQIYEETLNWVFDFDSDRTFFERTRKHVSGDRPVFGSFRKSAISLTPDKLLLVRGNRPDRVEVTVMNPDVEEISGYFKPVFNLRSLGLEGLQNAGATGLRYDYPFLYGSDKNATIANEENQVGIRRIDSFVQPLGEDATGEISTWWCDEKQGLQPIRYEMKRGYPDPSSKKEEMRNKHSRILEEGECTWQEIDGVWVLSTLTMLTRSGSKTERLELDFSWSSVNKVIPTSKFDWKSWDLHDQSRVVDLRMGEDRPVLVTVVGDSPVVAVGRTLESPTKSHSSTLLYVNLVAIGLLGGWAIQRAWLKQKRN